MGYILIKISICQTVKAIQCTKAVAWISWLVGNLKASTVC